MQMLAKNSLNFISRAARKANQNKPDGFGEMHFRVTSVKDCTVRLQNNSRSGVVALESRCEGIVRTQSSALLALRLHTSKARSLSEVFYRGGGRGEKKTACDGEHDGAVEETDGVLSQCAARMMDEL